MPGQAGLVNDGYQEGFTVYVSKLDLATQPQRFDRVRIRGEERTIEESHGIEANGATLVWMLRVLG
jgi:hypothetical protein